MAADHWDIIERSSMDFTYWQLTSAFVAALGAIVGALLPVLWKWIVSRRESSQLKIQLGDGTTLSLKAKNLDEESIRRLVKALRASEEGGTK